MSSSPPPVEGSSDVPFAKHLSAWTSPSPHRHRHRTVSATRQVKETLNARSEHINSEDDGASQRRINQYLIQQEIGRGSFGSVHLATDQFGHEYAVKEFSKSRLRRRAKSNLLRQAKQQKTPRSPGTSSSSLDARSDNQFLSDEDNNAFDLIKEEIAIMKKLNHENLVSLFEVLDDPEEDSLFMVLEMCKKGVIMRIDIDETVQPYNEENCRFWFRDLVLGIEYLHAQGVVHRDIKPDNCLLTDDDTLKLVDFGVSEMFEKSSNMKIDKSAGSPAFMAPELCIINKDGVHGRPADIWSMGITLYCLLFGHVPFQKSNMLELYDSIVQDEVIIPDTCSKEARDLLIRLLDKNPDQRITMPVLREHPWVTENGADPLLPAEDNCASQISPPTEEEKNAAITGNMGKLMAVLKAAGKFKQLLERRRPELFEGILGRASKMVAPPLTMEGVYKTGSDIKGALRQHFYRKISAKDEVSTTVATSSDIYRNEDDAPAAEKLSDHLNRTSIDSSAAVDAPRSPEPGPDVMHSVRLHSHEHGDSDHCNEPRRHTYDEFTRGHAHNVLADNHYLNIGEGPQKGETMEPSDSFVVSESPPATELSVFERAYKEEVSAIENSGRKSTIYSTRRIDKNESPVVRSLIGGFAGAVGRAMQKDGAGIQSAGQALQLKYDEGHGETVKGKEKE